MYCQVFWNEEEKAMAIHSSILAWKIPWTEEPGRLQSMGSQSLTWMTDFTFTFSFKFREGNGNPLQHSCLENPMGRGAWWAAILGVTKSLTQLTGWARSTWSEDRDECFPFLPMISVVILLQNEVPFQDTKVMLTHCVCANLSFLTLKDCTPVIFDICSLFW